MEVKKLAKTTTITMRVDGDLKRQAELVCEHGRFINFKQR